MLCNCLILRAIPPPPPPLGGLGTTILLLETGKAFSQHLFLHAKAAEDTVNVDPTWGYTEQTVTHILSDNNTLLQSYLCVPLKDKLKG